MIIQKIFFNILLFILFVSIIIPISNASSPIPDTHEDYPSWSPDGNKILFSSYGPNVEGIFTINPDGNQLELKTNSGEKEPSWSPDGSKIVFIKKFYNGTDTRNWSNDIGTLDLKTGIITRLTFNGNELDKRTPRYSPDGKYIIFESSKDSYVINSDGSNLRLDKTNISWQNDTSHIEYIYDPSFRFRPVYSPDGNYVTFISDMDGGNTDLFVARSNGSDIYRIVFNTNPGALYNPEYFHKKSRPVPPTWPWSPVAVPTVLQNATITSTPAASIPGFSLTVALASLFLSVLINRRK